MYRLGVWALLIAAAMLVESVSHAYASSGRASLGLGVTSYLSSTRTDPSLDLGLSGKFESAISGAGTLSSRFYLNEEHSFAIELPELYASTQVAGDEQAQVSFSLGRRLERWSRLDETWELGLWQPRFRWDYLHPMAVGLIGIFVGFETHGVRLTGFATPLFIPERGAPVEEDRGALRSDSPWFISPVRTAQVQGVSTQVDYAIDTPPLRDILLHAGGALQLSVGEERGPWASVAYARKPMNQLAFGASGFYSLGLSTIQGTIHPRVIDHELVSVEGGYASRELRAWLAMFYERPIADLTPSDWTSQRFEIARALSPGLSFALGRASEISLSYLYVSGGNAPDSAGAISAHSSSESVFEERYPFKSAFKAKGSTQVPGPWKQRLRGETGVLVDAGRAGVEPGGGLIWSTAFSYAAPGGRGVAATVGTDIFFADGASSSAVDFISRNRSNHQIRAGVSYAF